MLKLMGVPASRCWLARCVPRIIPASSASNTVCPCAVPSWYLSVAVSVPLVYRTALVLVARAVSIDHDIFVDVLVVPFD